MCLKFGDCGCKAPLLARRERSIWMRFFFRGYLLYDCRHCGTEVLSKTPPRAEHSFEASEFWNSSLRPIPAEQLHKLGPQRTD